MRPVMWLTASHWSATRRIKSIRSPGKVSTWVSETRPRAELLIPTKQAGGDLGDAALLKRYEDWRRPDVLAMIGMTDSLNALFMSRLPPIRLARGLGIARLSTPFPAEEVLHASGNGPQCQLPKTGKGRKTRLILFCGQNDLLTVFRLDPMRHDLMVQSEDRVFRGRGEQKRQNP